MRNRNNEGKRVVIAFVALGLIVFSWLRVPYAGAHDNNQISLTVEPLGITIPVSDSNSQIYMPVDPDGQETVVTVTSGTSEPHQSDPDTWYIWMRAKNNAITGPDPIPVSRLDWMINRSGVNTPLSNQWVRIATHRGTKHDPAARDTLKFRLRLERNEIFAAGTYRVDIEYNASHDPYSPQF